MPINHSDSEFRVDSQELLTAFGPATEQFLSPLHTNELAAAVKHAVEHGKDGAYLAPAVDFAMGVALNTCQLPSVRERWPSHVSDRALALAHIAGSVATMGTEQQLFDRAYREKPLLCRIFNPADVPLLRNANHMRSLCQPPFSDAAVIGGGALRALRKYENDRELGEQATAIAASHSLRLPAQVQTRNMSKVLRLLGKPYALVRHYEVDADNGSVDFTEQTRRILRGWSAADSGCPALTLKLNNGEGETLFSQRWLEIMHLLLSEGANVSR